MGPAPRESVQPPVVPNHPQSGAARSAGTTSVLAMSPNNISLRLADLGRRKEGPEPSRRVVVFQKSDRAGRPLSSGQRGLASRLPNSRTSVRCRCTRTTPRFRARQPPRAPATESKRSVGDVGGEQELTWIREKAAKFLGVRTTVIARADHTYSGRERELAANIVDWVSSI